jgi:hypothetical protein
MRPAQQERDWGVCGAHLAKETGASALSVVRMSNRDVIARLLNNQGVRAENGNNPKKAFLVYPRITQVAPGALDAWQKRARLELASNDVAAARTSLVALSEAAPDKQTRDRIIGVFDALGPTIPVTP